MLIYKEVLPADTMDIRKIKLPYQTADRARAAILKLDMQYDMPCMWFQADSDEEEKEYLLLAIGTGHDWGDALDRGSYIGTLLLMGGTLVLHYFLTDLPESGKGNADEPTV